MLLVSYKESLGRTRYLTECFGGYFWGPSRILAHQFFHQTDALNEGVKNLPHRINRENLEIGPTVFFLAKYCLGPMEENWYIEKANGGYCLTRDRDDAHEFHEEETALKIGNKVGEENKVKSGFLFIETKEMEQKTR